MQIAVGFDFDHTLGIDNKLERTVALEIASTLCAQRGAAFDAAAATARFDEEIALVRRGDAPVETMVEGWLQAVAGSGNENVIEAGRFRDTVTARAPEFVRALPGAKAAEPLLPWTVAVLVLALLGAVVAIFFLA